MIKINVIISVINHINCHQLGTSSGLVALKRDMSQLYNCSQCNCQMICTVKYKHTVTGIKYTWSVYRIHLVCVQNTLGLCISYTQSVYSIHLVCVQNTLCLYTVYIWSVYKIHSVCVQNTLGLCTLPKRSEYIIQKVWVQHTFRLCTEYTRSVYNTHLVCIQFILICVQCTLSVYNIHSSVYSTQMTPRQRI